MATNLANVRMRKMYCCRSVTEITWRASSKLKASHAFNLLDARKAISVTERQRYILRVRTLARGVAQGYFDSRMAAGFPLASPEIAQEVLAQRAGESK